MLYVLIGWESGSLMLSYSSLNFARIRNLFLGLSPTAEMEKSMAHVLSMSDLSSLKTDGPCG